MADIERVDFQPTPDEFAYKRSIFERLQSMGREIQRHRRAMGYVWLEGGIKSMDGGATGPVRIHARQSGLIIVAVNDPKPHLRMEPTEVRGRLATFHRAQQSDFVVEYSWDEAMMTERMV